MPKQGDIREIEMIRGRLCPRCKGNLVVYKTEEFQRGEGTYLLKHWHCQKCGMTQPWWKAIWGKTDHEPPLNPNQSFP